MNALEKALMEAINNRQSSATTAYERLMPKEKSIEEYQKTAAEELRPFLGSRGADRDYDQSQVLFSAAKNFFDYGNTGEFGPAASNFIGDVSTISKAAIDAEKQRKLAIGTRALASRDKDIDARRALELAIAKNKGSTKSLMAKGPEGKTFFGTTPQVLTQNMLDAGIDKDFVSKVVPNTITGATDSDKKEFYGVGATGTKYFGKNSKEIQDKMAAAKEDPDFIKKMVPYIISAENAADVRASGDSQFVRYLNNDGEYKEKFFPNKLLANEFAAKLNKGDNLGKNNKLISVDPASEQAAYEPINVVDLTTKEAIRYNNFNEIPQEQKNANFHIGKPTNSNYADNLKLAQLNFDRKNLPKEQKGEESSEESAASQQTKYVGTVELSLPNPTVGNVRGLNEVSSFPLNAIRPVDLRNIKNLINNKEVPIDFENNRGLAAYLFKYALPTYKKNLANQGIEFKDDPYFSNPEKYFELIEETTPEFYNGENFTTLLSNVGGSSLINNVLGGAGSILDISLTEAQTNQVTFNKLAEIIDSKLQVQAFNELALTTPRFTQLVKGLVKPFKLPAFGPFVGEQQFAEALKAKRQSYKSSIKEIAEEIKRGFENPNETTVKRMDEAKALYETMLPGYVALSQLTNAVTQAKLEEKVSKDKSTYQKTSNFFRKFL